MIERLLRWIRSELRLLGLSTWADGAYEGPAPFTAADPRCANTIARLAAAREELRRTKRGLLDKREVPDDFLAHTDACDDPRGQSAGAAAREAGEMSYHLIARWSVVAACDRVFARGVLAFAVALVVVIVMALYMDDAPYLRAMVAAIGFVSIGIAIGAQLVARRVR